ncbi:MAG TPA: helix-turn-helix transcriptional regulator [Candidatus Elarobacter sp.]|nr:helix-turn-helix transcriptional regulator [Candidatus Elarobacter sp.]
MDAMQPPKNDHLPEHPRDGDVLTYHDLSVAQIYTDTAVSAQTAVSIGTATNVFGLRWTDAQSGSQDVVLRPGRINITPAGVVRRAEWSPGAQFVVSFVDVAKVAARAAPGFSSDEVEFRTVTAETDPDLSELVVTLARETKKAAFDQSLRELSILLVRRYVTIQARTDRLSTEERASIVRLVDSRLDVGCSVERVARAVGYSRTHFARVFKAAFGTSVHRFVIDRRIERASILLAVTDLAIGVVAAEVGFASSAHLASSFASRTGRTPSRYRRESVVPRLNGFSLPS